MAVTESQIQEVLKVESERVGIEHVYDPDHPVSYGYYHCLDCDTQFYGPGNQAPSMHKPRCPRKNFRYIVGPKFIARQLG